mgnify:CR=1 FL=1
MWLQESIGDCQESVQGPVTIGSGRQHMIRILDHHGIVLIGHELDKEAISSSRLRVCCIGNT